MCTIYRLNCQYTNQQHCDYVKPISCVQVGNDIKAKKEKKLCLPLGNIICINFAYISSFSSRRPPELSDFDTQLEIIVKCSKVCQQYRSDRNDFDAAV